MTEPVVRKIIANEVDENRDPMRKAKLTQGLFGTGNELLWPVEDEEREYVERELAALVELFPSPIVAEEFACDSTREPSRSSVNDRITPASGIAPPLRSYSRGC